MSSVVSVCLCISLKALEAELKESFKQWEAIVERLEGQLRKTKQEAAMAVDLHQEEMKQAKYEMGGAL